MAWPSCDHRVRKQERRVAASHHDRQGRHGAPAAREGRGDHPLAPRHAEVEETIPWHDLISQGAQLEVLRDGDMPDAQVPSTDDAPVPDGYLDITRAPAPKRQRKSPLHRRSADRLPRSPCHKRSATRLPRARGRGRHSRTAGLQESSAVATCTIAELASRPPPHQAEDEDAPRGTLPQRAAMMLAVNRPGRS